MAIFRPEDEAKVRELFEELVRPVELVVAHGPEEMPLAGAARDVDFGAETEKIVGGLADLSDFVTMCVEHEPPRVAARDATPGPGGGSAGAASGPRFERYPAVSVQPEGRDVGVRYYGLPFGYELGSLIGAIIEAGRDTSSLSPETLERLAALDRDVAIDVFVTPT